MAHNERFIEALPERVFEVLADAYAYGDWVVGSQTIRDADPGWPAPGTRLYHRVGVGPLSLRDHTESVSVDAPRRLVLHARARPLVTAQVEITLHPRGSGTEVHMDEGAADSRSRVVLNRLTDPLIRLRNAESLRRLRRLAETGAA